MKVIKILGTGCANCTSTEKLVQEVVNELNSNATVIKVEDMEEILLYDILSTPAIVIDGKVVFKGRVPSKEEVKALLVDDFASTACCSIEIEDNTCCTSSNNEPCC